jgi:hypothetical protein
MAHYTKRYVGGFADSPSTTSAIDSAFLNAVETALLILLGADPTDGQAQVYDNALGRFKTALLKNENIDPAAAIDKTKLAALNLVNADVAAGAAIDGSKIAGNFPISKLNGYPNLLAKFLKGDGSWGNLFLASGTRASNLTGVTQTTFATASDILASSLNFTADGSSNYLVVFFAYNSSNASAAANNILSLNLDGSEYTRICVWTCPSAAAFAPLFVAVPIIAPSAGAHTVNFRCYVGGGTGSINVNTAPMFGGLLAV